MNGKDASLLPPGWSFVRLGTVGEWRGGGTPSKHNAEYWQGGNIPWVSPKDMKRFRINDAEDHITEPALETSVKLVPERSVLMVTRSGILAHTFPVAINLVPVTVNQDIKALTPLAPVDPLYIGYGLKALGQSILHDCSKDGTTVASVETDALKNYQVPIAPAPEQRRVVQAIESYLSRLDDTVATLERVRRNLKRYRASVFKAAVEGRLVPTEAELARKEGRDYEPADALLARILEERKARWVNEEAEKGRAKAEAKATKAGKPWTEDDDKAAFAKAHGAAAKRYKTPAGRGTSELPDLPEGWIWATWDQLGFSQNGRAFPSKEYRDDGVKLLRPGNLDESGRVDWTERNTRYMPERWAQLHPGHIVGPGELVMNLTAQSLKDEFLGRVCLTGAADRCLLNQRIARLTPILANERYLLWMFKAPIFRRFVDSLNTGSLIQHMFTSQLADFVVPLPPEAEQSRIADEVERLLAVGNFIGREASNSNGRAATLRQSILKWAFEGKLVDQDPNDEPASVLLDRIQAEREQARANASSKKKPVRKARKKKSA